VPTDDGLVETSISRREGIIVETASSPEMLYVNGREPVAFRARAQEPDPFLARQNPEGKPVDFGPVVTAGACRLTPEGKALQVTPLPGNEGSGPVVRIHWSKLPWPLPEPAHVESLDETGNVTSRQPVRREGEAIVLKCKPGVFAYRVVAAQTGDAAR